MTKANENDYQMTDEKWLTKISYENVWWEVTGENNFNGKSHLMLSVFQIIQRLTIQPLKSNQLHIFNHAPTLFQFIHTSHSPPF